MVCQVLKGDQVASGRCCIQLFMNSMSQDEALRHLGHAKVISHVCSLVIIIYLIRMHNACMITQPTTSGVDSWLLDMHFVYSSHLYRIPDLIFAKMEPFGVIEWVEQHISTKNCRCSSQALVKPGPAARRDRIEHYLINMMINHFNTTFTVHFSRNWQTLAWTWLPVFSSQWT